MMQCCMKANEKGLYKTYSQLTTALRAEGLESSQIILGFDFSSSNATSGKKAYKHCMHDINRFEKTPYERVATMMSFIVNEFSESQRIPAYVFGCAETRDKAVAPLKRQAKDEFIDGMDQVLQEYRKACKTIVMHGPTTMSPLIRKAVELCQQKKQYHILIIITDGDMSNEEMDAQEVIAASNYPLSIVVVGVGDGPFEAMDRFDNKLKKRKFDNFNFFNYTEAEKKKLDYTENQEEYIAVEMLQEIPAQFRDIRKLGYL